MIGSTHHKRKAPAEEPIAVLPKGVKVVSAPKSAARRRLLCGPDIETSGGCRIVHHKHFLGADNQIFFLMDVFPSTDPGGYRIEIVPVPGEPGQRGQPEIESLPTTIATRKKAQAHRRTTYDQAVLEARAHAVKRFSDSLAESTGRGRKPKQLTPHPPGSGPVLQIVESQDWKDILQQLRHEGRIDDPWIEIVAQKTQSEALRAALRELKRHC